MFFIGFNFFRGLLGLLMLPLAIWAAWWTYNDVINQKLRYPWLWAGVAFSIFPLGFFVYLFYRIFNRNRV